MSLWIRSQDKEMLMLCKAVGIGLEDDKSIYSNGYVLGTYSTREKALKVLDMIEKKIMYNGELFGMPQEDEVLECKKD